MSDDGIYNMLTHVYVLVLDGSEYDYYNEA